MSGDWDLADMIVTDLALLFLLYLVIVVVESTGTRML